MGSTAESVMADEHTDSGRAEIERQLHDIAAAVRGGGIAAAQARAMMAERPRREPWEALIAAFCAGFVVASALIAAAVWALSHLMAVPR
jgi:hypothetical protein